MVRIFGTDGVRGIANAELTAELAYNLGRAGAFVLTEGNNKPIIIVGKDTRISGDMLEASLVAGILSVGAEAICVGELPTPAIAYLTRKYNANAGVVISASHNPVEYNGIKFFDESGYKLSDALEDKIQRVIENDFKGVPSPIGIELGRKILKENSKDDYVEFLKNTIDVSLEGLKVALDCANGAAYEVAVNVFNDLGADVLVINNKPDGTNINENCGSTHPEELINFVVNNKCGLGFAFDGDADRCLAIDGNGKLIHGDFILTLCGKYLKDIGDLKENTIICTIMSNLGMVLACETEGIKTVTTKVGDRYVLEKMLEKGYILGGEQSGHIIFLKHNTTGDGLVTALQVASIVKKTGKSLNELASIMKELPQVLINIKISNSKKDIYEKDDEIISEIQNIQSALKGKGRVLIRASGTEPLLRVMLEGENQEEINNMCYNLVKLIEEKAKV